MRSAGTVVLIGALVVFGAAAAAVVAAWWLGTAAELPRSPQPTQSVQVHEANDADLPGRTHVIPSEREYSPAVDGAPAAPTIDAWLSEACGDGDALESEYGDDVEWWDFPLDDVMAALLAVIEQDGMERSGTRALEEIRRIGYLAAPWAADVAHYLGESRFAVDAVLTLAAMGPDALPVLRSAAASDDASIRGQAMLALSEATYRRREVVEMALLALRDEDAIVRLCAIEVLAAHDEAPELSIPALAERVSSTDDATRREVMEALTANGPVAAAAVPALMGLIADHRARRAEDAVRAFREIGAAAQPAVPTMLALVVSNPDVFAKSVPEAVLGVSADAYLAALAHDHMHVRGAFAERAELLVKAHPDRVDEVIAALVSLRNDDSSFVRFAAKSGLARVATWQRARDRAITRLSDGLLRPTRDTTDARIEALDTIVRQGPAARSLAPVIRGFLHSPDERTRLHAALAAWSVDPPATDVEPILLSFREHGTLRRELYLGLVGRPPLSWSEYVVDQLHDEPDTSNVLGPALDVVLGMGEHALDPLTRLAQRETRDERIAWIATLLYEIGPPAVPAMRELADRPGLLPPIRAELLRYADMVR